MSDVSFLPPFISTRSQVRTLSLLLILSAAVAWTAVGVDWALLHLADEVREGYEVTRENRLAHTRTAAALADVQWVCALLTGGFFLAWLYQCRVNVRALGARKLRWRREWTILGFLVPFLNFVRPFQVIREVWQASDPSRREPLGWQEVRVSRLLACWWGSFLVFISFELIAWSILLGIDTGGERRVAYTLRALADGSAGLSASLAYFVVHRITNLQEEKVAAQGGRGITSLDLDPRDAIASP